MSAEAASAYVLFFTSNHAFRAEKLLRAAAIDCKLVPVPRRFSSECGVCLRIACDADATVRKLLGARQVEIDDIRAE